MFLDLVYMLEATSTQSDDILVVPLSKLVRDLVTGNALYSRHSVYIDVMQGRCLGRVLKYGFGCQTLASDIGDEVTTLGFEGVVTVFGGRCSNEVEVELELCVKYAQCSSLAGC